MSARTHTRTPFFIRSHVQPSTFLILITFFYLQSTQRDTEKNLTEIVNYHLRFFFSYFISFWKYFFKQLLNDASEKTWHISSGHVDRERKRKGCLFWGPVSQMPCFFLLEQKPVQSACPSIVPEQIPLNELSSQPACDSPSTAEKATGHDCLSSSFSLIRANTAVMREIERMGEEGQIFLIRAFCWHCQLFRQIFRILQAKEVHTISLKTPIVKLMLPNTVAHVVIEVIRLKNEGYLKYSACFLFGYSMSL